MDLLKAVNRILPVLGEHPVTSLDTRSRTLAIILPVIEAQIDEVTTLGGWYNTHEITLYPDSEGGIAVPSSTISFTPDEHPASVRDTRLFNMATFSYFWDTPVKGTLIERLPFNHLPESVASQVFYGALVKVYVTDIGMEQNVRLWMAEEAAASTRVLSEHLRNLKYSTRKSPRWGKRLRAMRA